MTREEKLRSDIERAIALRSEILAAGGPPRDRLSDWRRAETALARVRAELSGDGQLGLFPFFLPAASNLFYLAASALAAYLVIKTSLKLQDVAEETIDTTGLVVKSALWGLGIYLAFIMVREKRLPFTKRTI